MLSFTNEVDPLIFPLRMFCMQYKHVFFQQQEPVLGNYTYKNNVRMDKYLAVALQY